MIRGIKASIALNHVHPKLGESDVQSHVIRIVKVVVIQWKGFAARKGLVPMDNTVMRTELVSEKFPTEKLKVIPLRPLLSAPVQLLVLFW